jgi:hypothetical protein
MAPYLAWGAPAFALFIIGIGLGGFIHARIGLALFLMLIWTACFVSIGIRLAGTQEFFVVERLGSYFGMKKRGINFMVLPGIIDQVKSHGTFAAQEIELYTDEASNEIDFTDASAPIDASAWFHIADPDAVLHGRWGEVREQVYCYTYSVGNAPKRIAQLFEGALSPILQSKTIGEAQKNGTEDGKHAADIAAPGLVEIGVFPRKQQPIIIHDIEVPPKIIELRNERLEGEVHAERMKREASGYSGSIVGVARDLGLDLANREDRAEAREIVLTQKALDTVAKTGSNVTFVSPGVTGMLGTFNLGKKRDDA